MNKDVFLHELLVEYYASEYGDIFGERLQDLLIKHGLVVERPITAMECKSEWAQEHGLKPGDVTAFQSQELKEFLRTPAPQGE